MTRKQNLGGGGGGALTKHFEKLVHSGQSCDDKGKNRVQRLLMLVTGRTERQSRSIRGKR